MIGEDEVGMQSVAQQTQRGRSVFGGLHGIALAFEKAGGQFADIGIVFDEKDGALALTVTFHHCCRYAVAAALRHIRRSHCRTYGTPRPDCRKIERHRRPDIGLAVDRQRAARLACKAARMFETQSIPPAHVPCREQVVERTRLHIGSHRDAGIMHGDGDILTMQIGFFASKRDVARPDRDAPAPRHGVARTDADIEQRQIELFRIGVDRPDIVMDMMTDGDVAAQRLPQQRNAGADPPHNVDRFRLHRPAPRQGQEPLGQFLAAQRGLAHAYDQAFEPWLVADIAIGKFCSADDHREEIVEVMDHAAGQLADGLEFL